METNHITISGNKWIDVTIRTLASCAGALIVTLIFMHKSITESFPILIGLTIGMLLVNLSTLLKKYDIRITSDTVEGPQRQGFFIERQTVSLSDIDISTSRRPSIMKNGYLTVRNGNKIILSNSYFNKSQSNLIFEEIEKRLTNALAFGDASINE